MPRENPSTLDNFPRQRPAVAATRTTKTTRVISPGTDFLSDDFVSSDFYNADPASEPVEITEASTAVIGKIKTVDEQVQTSESSNQRRDRTRTVNESLTAEESVSPPTRDLVRILSDEQVTIEEEQPVAQVKTTTTTTTTTEGGGAGGYVITKPRLKRKRQQVKYIYPEEERKKQEDEDEKEKEKEPRIRTVIPVTVTLTIRYIIYPSTNIDYETAKTLINSLVKFDNNKLTAAEPRTPRTIQPRMRQSATTSESILIKQTVKLTLTAAYDTAQTVTLTLTSYYDIANTVTQTSPVISHDTYATVTASLTSSYDILTEVNAILSANYDIPISAREWEHRRFMRDAIQTVRAINVMLVATPRIEVTE